MSAAPRRAPGPLLPRGGDRTLPFLLLLSLLASIAALLSMGVAVGGRTAAEWRGRLDGSATVAVQGAGLESADAAAARASEILTATSGVIAVRALDAATSDRLVDDLMRGSPHGAAPADIRLLAVTLAPRAAPSAATLASALRREGLAVSVDLHKMAGGRLWDDALAVSLGLAAAAALLLAGAFALASLTTRRVLRRQAAALDLLQVMGAPDDLTRRLVRNRTVLAASLWSATGVVVAVLLAAGARLSGKLPQIGWLDLTAAAPWMAVASFLAVIAASLSTRAALQRAS